MIDSSNALASISCPASTFCAAIDFFGGAVTFNGSSWSSRTSIDTVGQPHSVSCASASFCAAIDNQGKVTFYRGSSWSTPASSGANSGESISCPASSFCTVVDAGGGTVTYNGSKWSTRRIIDASQTPTSVSCSSSSACAAVDGGGNALLYRPPVVTSLVPNAGPVGGGTKVTVTGENFTPTAKVLFGTTAGSSVTLVSPTKLTVVAPAGSAGVVHVTVVTQAGGSVHVNADLYAYGPPSVSSFTPASGPVGSSVTINGNGFVPGATVKFAGTPSPSVTFVSATRVRATVPSGAVAGKISVTTAAGTGTSTGTFTPT
jgi:hypothetical protein